MHIINYFLSLTFCFIFSTHAFALKGLTMQNDRKSVLVIGLGMSGISQLRIFKKLEKQGKKIPKIVAYEKQSSYGGLWNKTDKIGDNVHSGMYNHLWSNGPKECLELSDYTFKDHFKFPIPSYPPYEVLKNYIDGYYSNSDISDWVQFNTVVKKVRYIKDKKKFIVKSQKFNSKKDIIKIYEEEYDYVIVATGHFSKPNRPDIEGLDSFNGKVIHAHDFRNAEDFKDKDVVLIGSSYSAEDIGSQCLKYGANSITLSYRTNPTCFAQNSNFYWGNKWKEHKMVTRIKDNNFFFSDGYQCKADAIIMCTGYKYDFPFLENKLKLNTSNKLWVSGLYNGVVWEDNTQLIYLGMQDQFFTFNMFAVQASYAKDVIMGKVKLPHKQDRLLEDEEWLQRFNTLKNDEDMINFQGDYIKHLLTLTDYPNFDVSTMCKIFMEWEQYKHNNPMDYRDFSHTSAITNTKAPKLHQTWFKNFDDSFKNYMKHYNTKP